MIRLGPPITSRLRMIPGLILGPLLIVGCAPGGERELPYLVGYDFEDGHTEGLLPKDADSWLVADEDGSMVYRLTAPGEHG